MIVVKKFVYNPFNENTYIIWDEFTLETMIVDPGCADKNEEENIVDFISERKMNIKYLINTHCHIDHIFGNKFIKDKYNPVYFVPEADLPLLQHAEQQASVFGMQIKQPPMPDQFLSEYSNISLGNTKPKLLSTPGHSPGEYSIYFEKEKFCIAGDVLFNGSIGRTDLWGGDYELLIHSIKDKLMILPDDVTVYPGHGEITTIGNERSENPFLRN